MATLQEAIEKGHKRYFKNSYWKELYEDAPEDAKPYYDLIFSQLDGGNDEENDAEFKAMMESTYKGMSEYGWDYIINNTTNQMAKWRLKDKRSRFASHKNRP